MADTLPGPGRALRPVSSVTKRGVDDVAVVTKTDLAVACEFDWQAASKSIDAVRPGMRVLEVSAKTRDGMTEWLQFLESSKLARSAAGECR